MNNDLGADKKEKTGIAMTKRNPTAKPVDTPGDMSVLQQASRSLLNPDSDDEIELPSRKRGEPISLLDRFEASGITRKAPIPKSKGPSERSEIDSAISSPMHSTPSTPIRERRPRYRDQENDGEGDED